jgi:predicted cupin superfamily sugar epimerase
MDLTAEALIERLSLEPHPEGGWFRFCGRSGAAPEASAGLEGRRDSCSYIYYLLRRNEISRWHRLKSSEVWTWHAGGSLLMTLGGGGALPAAARMQAMGPRLELGEQFSLLAPAGQWQTTRVTRGDFVLVSCVVAPAYDDEDCLLPEKPLPNEIYPENGGIDDES